MTRDSDWPLVGLVAVVAAFFLGAGLIDASHPDPPVPVCWSASAEDGLPVKVPCDYRDGAWWPRVPPVTLPPCDDDAPGRPVTGTCWLSDDDGVAVWPHPYQGPPLYILRGSQP